MSGLDRLTNTWRVGLLDQHGRRVADQVVSRVEVASMVGVGSTWRGRDLTFTDLPGACVLTDVALIPPDGAFVTIPLGYRGATTEPGVPVSLHLPDRIEAS